MTVNRMLLSDIVAFSARRAPDATAMMFGDDRWTYREFLDRINRTANAMLTLGAKGERVAILAENLPEYVEAYYAIPRAGMCLVFVNYRLAPREIEHIVRDSGSTLMITEPKYAEVSTKVAGATGVRRVLCIGCEPTGAPDGTTALEPLVQQASPEEPPDDVDTDDLAWLIYTSGTTGLPKGAMLSHANLVAAVSNSAIQWPSDITGPSLFPWPLCHVAGYGILMLHLRARTLVLMRAYEPLALLQHIERYAVEETTVAPTMFSMLLRHPAFDEHDVSTIRRIGYGAAAMPAEVLRQGMKRFPNAQFATGFGMTELAGNVLYHPYDQHLRGLEEKPDLLVSVGKPMPLGMVRVVDDAMNDVGTGEVGELVIRGPQVTQGYWNNPGATAEAFAGGWFHSGDLGVLEPDGYVKIKDRSKDIIISGGENISSIEVEDVLYRHPAVLAAAVVARPDPKWGETPVAFIELKDGARVSADDIIAHCRRHLSGFKVPRHVEFGEIPKTSTGKIQKFALRDRAKSASAIDV